MSYIFAYYIASMVTIFMVMVSGNVVEVKFNGTQAKPLLIIVLASPLVVPYILYRLAGGK